MGGVQDIIQFTEQQALEQEAQKKLETLKELNPQANNIMAPESPKKPARGQASPSPFRGGRKKTKEERQLQKEIKRQIKKQARRQVKAGMFERETAQQKRRVERLRGGTGGALRELLGGKRELRAKDFMVGMDGRPTQPFQTPKFKAEVINEDIRQTFRAGITEKNKVFQESFFGKEQIFDGGDLINTEVFFPTRLRDL